MKYLFEIYFSVFSLVNSQHTTDRNQVETCQCQRHETACKDVGQSLQNQLILQQLQMQAQLSEQRMELQNQSLQCQSILNLHLQQLQAQYVHEQQSLPNQSLQQQRILELERMQTQHVKQQTDLENKFENITRTLNAILLHKKQAEEQAKNTERESPLNARSFVSNPRVLGVTSGGAFVQGITVMSDHLFAVRRGSSVYVYNTNSLVFTRDIPIPGSSSLHSIVASPRYNCLYISDTGTNVVYRYNLSDNVISSWSVGGGCYGLSLTSTHNVIATLSYDKQIKEYTPDGSLITQISLDGSMEHPWHSIQLSSGQFVVCHGAAGKLAHRVCTVDASGRVIQSYGGSFGEGVGQLHVPNNLAVDKHDNVLVTDWHNDRIVLLSASLTRLGFIPIPGYTLSRPRSLQLDLLSRRLYIAEENNNGRLFVLSV